MKQCTGNARRLRRNVQASGIALLLAWSLPPASPGGAQAQPGTPYAITGRVSEATDPAPIVRARIKLLHASDRSLIRDSIFTDESGAFRVNLEVAVGTEEPLLIAGAYAADPISPNPISGSTGRAVIRYTVRSNLPGEHVIEVSSNMSFGGGTRRDVRIGTYRLTLTAPQTQPAAIDAETEALFTHRSFNVFEFEAAAGNHINVALYSAACSGRLLMWLIEPSGRNVPHLRPDLDACYYERGVQTLAETGRYRVIVYTPNDIEVDGPFALGIARIDEPQPVTLSTEPVALSGAIGILGGRRFYRFEGTGGDVHNFILSHASGSELNATLGIGVPGSQPFFGRTRVRSANTNASTRTGETGAFSLPSSGEYVLEVKSSTAAFRSDRPEHTGTFEITAE